MFTEERDFDNQFFRTVTVSLAKTLSNKVRWINRFEDKNIRVVLPFYTSFGIDDRFMFDAFVDDITDKRVFGNTDQLQRGSISLSSIRVKSDEFANPNSYLKKQVYINDKIKSIVSKVKAVPVTVSYKIDIQLASMNEIDKCTQKLLNVFYSYKIFSFEYFGLPIKAHFKIPDDIPFEIPAEITMESDKKKKMSFTLDINTYYPIFGISSDDLIPCDNDSELDWESFGVPMPTNEFLQSLKDYNYSKGIENYKGGGNGDTKEGLTEIRNVNWSNFILKQSEFTENEVNNSLNPKKDKKEQF